MTESIHTQLRLSGTDCCCDRIPAPLHSSLAECLTSAAEIADYCAANAAAIDRHGAFPVHEFRQIAAAGLLAAPLLLEFGGLGLDRKSVV